MLVVLPTLLFIMFGIVELSRAWMLLNLTTTAAREAARAATVAAPDSFPNPPAAVQRLNDILGAGNWSGTVTCSASPCAPNQTVQASVNVTFQTVVPVLLPMLQTLPIQQVATMRYE
jgi:Flp pilus assembly protein TadG